jgi:hypothetical protein
VAFLLPGGAVFQDAENGATFLLPGGSVFTGIPAQIRPPLLTNTQTFYAATISATYTITVPLLTNEQVFYAFTLDAGEAPPPAVVYAGSGNSIQRVRGGRLPQLAGRLRAAQKSERIRVN